MLLEYQIQTTGLDRFLASQRTIEQTLERNANRGASRDAKVSAGHVRAAEKAAAGQVAADRKAAAASQREEERLLKWRQTIRNRHFQQLERDQRRHEARQLAEQRRADAASIREAERTARAQARTAQAHARATQRVLSTYAGGVARGVRGAAGLGASALRAGVGLATVGGGLAIGNAVRVNMSEQALATQLANQASDRADPNLRNKLLQESQGVKGFTGSEALGAMSEFVAKTGDLDTARQIIGDLGQLSLATGADLNDLGATAGQAFNVLKDQISDPIERVKELNSLMGALAQQGAMGAVEMKDLAGDFGKLGAATRSFEGGAPELLRTMGAFAQMAVARGGAEGSADASTASSRLASDIVTNKKKFAAVLGPNAIKSKIDPTKLRDPLAIMLDVLDKTKGDVEKTSGLFGMESRKIFNSLAASYSEAEKKQKGSGRRAVTEEFNRFAGAELSPEAIAGKADLRMSDVDMQLKDAAKNFNREVGGKLLPELTKLIPKIAELTPQVVALTESAINAAKWLAENPFAGAGIIVGGYIVKELAVAGIGQAVSSILAAVAARVGGASVTGAVIEGAGGLVGTAGAGAAAKGGKLAAAGRVASKLAPAAKALGRVSLVAGAAMTAKDWADEFASKSEQRNALEDDTLRQYSGAVGKNGSRISASAATDPSLMGSPAAIQAMLGGGKEQGPIKLEGMDSLKAALVENTNAIRAAGSGGGGGQQNRYDPILKR